MKVIGEIYSAVEKKKKFELIDSILQYYYEVSPNDNSNKNYYGDIFDKLYEKDLTELKLTLAVYKASAGKKYLK